MVYGISELARRSGFRPSTLRYYESIGLLPDAKRTGAGYRVYDDAAIERLAFISRAKTMGLALDDIAELVALWADGPCAPVQDLLTDLLDAKGRQVLAQLDDLSRFAAQLEHLRASLAATEPAERCGPGCGCDTELPIAVATSVKPTSSAPIACRLSATEAADRSTEWADLLAHVTDRHPAPNGIRLRLANGPEVAAAAAELTVREAQCCPFFSFTLAVDVDAVWLEVAAPRGGRGALDALFGPAND